MKMVLAVLIALSLVACQQKPADAKTETIERNKTTAEKAFDAGQNARKKAEKIKAEEEKKAKEAIESTEQ